MKKVILLISLFVLSACDEPSDELLAKSYTREELNSQICVQEKQCAQTEDRIWFIDEKFIFSYDLKTWSKRYEDGAKVAQVINFKGLPVGLVESGSVYISAKNEDGSTAWVDIARHSVKSIEVANDDLMGLGTDGVVYRYLGSPGEIQWDYMTIFMPMTMSCGQNCTTTIQIPLLIPIANGHEIAFEETDIKGIEAFIREGSSVYLKKQTGESVLYARDPGTEALANKP